MEKQILIGMTIEAAERFAGVCGHSIRVVNANGYECLITADLNAFRVNVDIETNSLGQDIVTRIAGVY